MTLVEKVIARAAGRAGVTPGEIVTAEVDFAFAHDSSGPRRWRPYLEELGVGLWAPSKVAIVSDHYVPAVDAESAEILKQTRAFVRDYSVGAFFDMVGICHLVLPEHGLIRPGHFICGGLWRHRHGGHCSHRRDLARSAGDRTSRVVGRVPARCDSQGRDAVPLS
jgi:3-isopropylmalate/(R)-2-methylmalate dehydratase large subunit